MQQRAPAALTMHLVVFPTQEVRRVPAPMLAGMAAYTSGLLFAAWSAPKYRRLMLVCLFVGPPIVLLGVAHRQLASWEMGWFMYLGGLFNYPGAYTEWLARESVCRRCRLPVRFCAVIVGVRCQERTA